MNISKWIKSFIFSIAVFPAGPFFVAGLKLGLNISFACKFGEKDEAMSHFLKTEVMDVQMEAGIKSSPL